MYKSTIFITLVLNAGRFFGVGPKLSGASASHQNGKAYSSIKTVVTVTSIIMIHAALRCTRDTFSTDFGQRKWTMLYVFTAKTLICSLVYQLLRNGKEQGLIHF